MGSNAIKWKGKLVEWYGHVTLMNLSMHYKNLYITQSNIENMMCYGSLWHMFPSFTMQDICISHKKLTSRNVNI